ncbi:hypothetical protein SAMN05428978_101957 [Nitrosomonas sp. Nm34]|nr:hypothetical protein SAMN05428978_101957 [Nitrosomonas sp. Nm34]
MPDGYCALRGLQQDEITNVEVKRLLKRLLATTFLIMTATLLTGTRPWFYRHDHFLARHIHHSPCRSFLDVRALVLRQYSQSRARRRIRF